jgi:taurine dioxygenase
MTRANAISIQPLSPAIGATMTGVDLADLSPALVEDIRAALLKHHVLFFEDQSLSRAQQRDAAALFGELHVHPLYEKDAAIPEIMVIDNHPGNPTDNDHWHTDVTFLETPAMGALLYAEQVPPRGGDTMWSSMTAAYRALSPAMQTFLQGLEAVHDFAFAFPPEGLAGSAVGREQYEKARASHPSVVHPVIRTHPETGEPGIFVNSVFTARIKGLRREESRAILAFLHRHIQQPEFTVRYRWKEGSLAFWDNRCTQHVAVNDYLPHRRVMRRATILGERPFFRPTA